MDAEIFNSALQAGPAFQESAREASGRACASTGAQGGFSGGGISDKNHAIDIEFVMFRAFDKKI